MLICLGLQVTTRLCHVVPISEFIQVGGKLRMVASRRQQNQEDAGRRIHQLCWAAKDDDNEMEMSSESDRDSFLERLGRAWSILFPPKPKSSTNAEIAKQRLRMILISDRCSVNDDAKRKILNNIVGALSDFVEIESEDKVQLNVTSDPDLGTVYSVTVPVRRVRPEYQEFSNELMNTELRTMEYMEGVDGSLQMVDFRFEHPDAEKQG